MKKYLFSILSFIFIVLLVSCDFKTSQREVNFLVDNVVVETQKVDKNTQVTEPTEPKKDGYEFIGWYLEDVKWDFSDKVKNDMDLTAKYEVVVNEYKVSFVVEGQTIHSETIAEGTKVSKPEDPIKENCEFAGWYVGGKEWDFDTPVTKNITLMAKFKESYKVSFVVESKTIYTLEVDKGGKVTKPEDPTKENCNFVGWYVAGKEWNFNDQVTKNMTLIAKFKENIDLMDYYVSMEDHLDSTFKQNLHLLLKSNVKKLSYSDVWTALQTVDAVDDLNIECIYTGQKILKTSKDGSSSASILWNREHSWPKSYGFNDKKYSAYTDIHHLFASEKNINSLRSNKSWNYVTNPTRTDEYGNKWNSNYFEIRDEVKGDIARAMFYMVVRYSDPNELYLELIEGTSSSSDKVGRLGTLSVLLEWHEFDPVSEEEMARNEAVYKIQGNRNPFVDYPEWVDLLYPGM